MFIMNNIDYALITYNVKNNLEVTYLDVFLWAILDTDYKYGIIKIWINIKFLWMRL